MINKKIICIIIITIFLINLIPSANSDDKIHLEKNEENKIEKKFITVEKIDDVWWFVNSNGEKFYSNTMTGTAPSPFYYGDTSSWLDDLDELLEDIGINTVTTSHESLTKKYYYIMRFRFKHFSITKNDGWNHNRFPDVFDPWWREQVKNATQKYAAPLKDDPLLLGYYTDNEMKWGPDIVDTLTILEVYMSAEKNTPGKQELIRFLKDKQYNNDITLFNLVWNMDLNSFKDLENHKEFGIQQAWRLRSLIKPEKNKIYDIYPKYKQKPDLMKQAESDIRSFSSHVAETYYNVTDFYLNKADPNHLNLGSRFHLHGVPEEVLVECGKYVDVISLNYYRTNRLMFDPPNYYTCKLYGCVTLENWMQKYYDITQKPLFIPEWNMRYKDRIIPIMTDDAIFVEGRTKKLRANNYKWYAKNCLERPYMVGDSWFCLRSKGFGFECNRGFIDIFDQQDEELIKSMRKICTNSEKIHEKSSKNLMINNINQELTFDIIIKNINPKKFEKKGETQIKYDDKYLKDNSIIRYNTVEKNYDEKNTLYVDDNSSFPGDGSKNWPYSKIGFAIENATNGDTIRVYDGDYFEKIIIDKPLSIIGNGSSSTTIYGIFQDFIFTSMNRHEINNNVITIESDDVKINGLNITTAVGNYIGSSGGKYACIGINIYNSNNCYIENNVFDNLGLGVFGRDLGKGIIVRKCSRINIKNNDFKKNDISVDSSEDIEIYNNSMNFIWLSQSKKCKIINNFISFSRYGISLIYSDDNLLEGNTIYKCGRRGLFLKNSNNNLIKENNFMGERNKINDFVSSLDSIRDYIYYISATYLNSKGNKWTGNYWEEGRIIPKIIIGRYGNDGLFPVLNIDWNPADKKL